MDGGGLRLSHRHNWFQYEDGAKKPVPATKGSLGIDYGEQTNENEENVDIAGLMKKYGGKQGAGVRYRHLEISNYPRVGYPVALFCPSTQGMVTSLITVI